MADRVLTPGDGIVKSDATAGQTIIATSGTIIHTLLWNAALAIANKYEPNPRPATGYYRYVGPTDPASLGITLRTGDEWINTAPAINPATATVYTMGADVSTAATAFADVTGLSFPVLAGVRYKFDVYIPWSATVTGVGTRWAVNGPATPTFLNYRANWSTTQTSQSVTNNNTYDQPGVGAASAQANNSNMAFLEGVITPSAAGTVIVRFAVGGTTQTITALAAGAELRVTRFP